MIEKEIQKYFVESWTTDTIRLKMIEKKCIKEFDRHLFKGDKLFKGKNIWIEYTIDYGRPTTITAKRKESNKSRIIQLWNYYIVGDFNQPPAN